MKEITQELLGITEEVESPDKAPIKRLKPESEMLINRRSSKKGYR